MISRLEGLMDLALNASLGSRFARCASFLKKLRRVFFWNFDELDVVFLSYLHQVVHIFLGFGDLLLRKCVVLRFHQSELADRLGGDGNAIEPSAGLMPFGKDDPD